MTGDDDTAYGLFESFLEICELWGWLGPSRFFNAHLLPQALQLTMDGAPHPFLQHIRLLPGASAVKDPAKRARNMSDQLVDLYAEACPDEDGCVFRDPQAMKPDWAGMHLSPTRWFSVTAEKLPERLLVRACKLVLVDYCCFDLVLPDACARAGLSCDDPGPSVGLPDWLPGERNPDPPLDPRRELEPVACCDLRIRAPLPPPPDVPPAPSPENGAPGFVEPPAFPADHWVNEGKDRFLHRSNDDDGPGPDVPPLHPAIASESTNDDAML